MGLESVGKVVSLFYSTNKARIDCSDLTFDHLGVLEDKFYNKNIERSVLITSTDSYTLAAYHDIAISYGTLGENVLVDFNPYDLEPGTKLSIGTVILEISQRCTLCKSLASSDKKLPKILKDDRGIFAKVIYEGNVQKGDTVNLLSDKTS